MSYQPRRVVMERTEQESARRRFSQVREPRWGPDLAPTCNKGNKEQDGIREPFAQGFGSGL